MMDQITTENWTFCHYKSSKLISSISVGMAHGASMEYFITVSDHDDREVVQRKFDTLEQAIKQLNTDYFEWDFINLNVSPSSNGCSDCAK